MPIKRYEYRATGTLHNWQIFNPEQTAGSTCDVLIVKDAAYFFGVGRKACLQAPTIELGPAAALRNERATQYKI